MRLIQIAIPEEQRDAMVDVLEERNFGYTITDGRAGHGERVIISFVLPADAVEHVLNDFEDEGFDTDTFTVSLQTQFATFDGIDEVQDTWAKTPNKIAPATLRSKAKDLRLNDRSYLWMMVLSTVIATAGLLLGSPAIVVGSMVLAPIVSPMLTASVGAVRDDRQMVIGSIQMQAFGLAVAIVGAFLFSLLAKHLFAVPMTLAVSTMESISSRFAPGILAITVGLASGAAGAFGLVTKGQVSIVGVMIAAALIPTAAASGIGFAWGELVIGVGALALLLVTIIAVNVGGYLMLYYLGYRPDDVDEGFFEVDTLREKAVLGGTILLVGALVVTVGFGAYQQFAFERSVNGATTEVLDGGDYASLEIVDTSVEYTGIGSVSDRPTVTVTLSRTAGRSYPGLPNAFDRAITNRTGEDVVVKVEYQEYDRSNVSGSALSPPAIRADPAI